jgi:phage-related protein
MARKLTVEFVGDSRQLEKTFSNVRGQTDKTGGSLSKLKGPAQTAGIALGAGLALAAKAGFDELKEGQQVSAQTAAVLKSTGGAAGVTAKDMEKLAGSISAKSGIDDEAIQSGENLLATFTNVRNETGKGNDVFSQATNTMADMSVALGQDMKSSSIQLGKALNDPIKGITALSRVGVSFTEGQKDQIKQMVAAGDTMGAQKLILKELNKEFGGSAKAAGDTLPGQMNKLKNSFAAVSALIVSSLVPAMQALAAIGAKVAGFLQEHPTLAKILITVLGTLAAALVAVNIATKAWTAVETLASVIRLKSTAQWIAQTAAMIAQKVAMVATTIATEAWTAAQWLLNAAMTANPIGLIVAGLVLLVAGLVVAYKHSETFRNLVQAAWDTIKGFAGWIGTAAVAAFNALKATLLAVFGALKTAFTTYFNAYKTIVTTVFNAIKTVATTVWTAIKTVLTTIWNGIKTIATTAFNGLKIVIMTPIYAVRDGLAVVWGAIKSVASTAWAGLKTLATNFWNGLKLIVLTPIRAVRDTLGGIWDSIFNKVTRIFDAIGDKARDFGNGIKSALVGAFQWAVNKIIDVLNVLIRAWNKVPFHADIAPIKYLGAKTGAIVGAARGGAFGRTNGLIKSPMMLMGEEAPRHPEIVIPTNPAYRKRAQQLTRTAIGAVGLQAGGITPYSGAVTPGGGVVVQVNVASGMEWLRDYIDVRIVERDRASAGTYNAGVS